MNKKIGKKEVKNREIELLIEIFSAHNDEVLKEIKLKMLQFVNKATKKSEKVQRSNQLKEIITDFRRKDFLFYRKKSRKLLAILIELEKEWERKI